MTTSKHLEEAQVLLEHLRSGTHHYRAFIQFMEQELAAGELTYHDLGITEADIDTFRREGSRRAIYFMLKDYRRGAPMPEELVQYLHEELAVSEWTLDELELTEAERAFFALPH